MAAQSHRIEAIWGGSAAPLVPLTPELSSVDVRWQGFLLEEHASHPGFAIDIPEHYSTKHLLHLNTGGPSSTDWRVDGKNLCAIDQTGSFSLLPAGVPSLVRLKHKTGGIVLEIDPLQLQRTLAEAGSGDKIELKPVFAAPDRQIALLLTAMREDIASGAPAGKLYGESIGNAVATYLAQRYSSTAPKLLVYKGGLSRSQLNRVFEYIEEHLAEGVGLSDLAAAAELSVYHFARQFRQSTGMAPHQYVLQRKIERAKETLRDPRKSILEASARVGFDDQSHFTKTFRRLVGITPTEFRSRL